MTYEDHFSKDWESITRGEAMVRAFVLGIAAVEGEEDPEELERLKRENNRAFVEMAYNAGRRERLDLDEETGSEAVEAVTDDPSTVTGERLSELVIPRPDAPDRSDGSEPSERTRPKSQVDVPAMLDAYEILDARPDVSPDEQDRLGLPDFLK